jgi:hypothetical protein
MALEDLLDLLGERDARGRIIPSRNLAEMQEDIDPETGAYNNPHLDTMTGELINPDLLSARVGGPLDDMYQPSPVMPDIGNQAPPRGIQASPMDEVDALAYRPAAGPTGGIGMLPQPPVADAQGGSPLIDTSSLPTGSVKNLEIGSRGIPSAMGDNPVAQPDITGTGAEDPDSTMNRLLRVISATGSDISGGLVGTRPESYGDPDLATKIAPFVLGGGAAAGAAKAIPGIAKGGGKLWDQLLRMIQGFRPSRNLQGRQVGDSPTKRGGPRYGD